MILRGPCFDVLQGKAGASGGDGVSGLAKESVEKADPIGPRLGLIVPKRLIRRAVLRNTIKRQIRESFRHHDRNNLPPVDLVFRLARWPQDVAEYVATPAVLKKRLRQEIDQLLMKLVRLPGALRVSASDPG